MIKLMYKKSKIIVAYLWTSGSKTGVNDQAIERCWFAGAGSVGQIWPLVLALIGTRSSEPHEGPVKPRRHLHVPLIHFPRSSQSSAFVQANATLLPEMSVMASHSISQVRFK